MSNSFRKTGKRSTPGLIHFFGTASFRSKGRLDRKLSFDKHAMKLSSTNEQFELKPCVIDRIDEEIDHLEVLRYLGYPVNVEPNHRIADIIKHWIEEASTLATPWAIYLVQPIIELDKRRLSIQSTSGVIEFNGAIGEFLGASKSMAAFIATAGPAIERRASELLRNGEDFEAMILNAVGAERAEAAEAAVMEQLREQAGAFGLAPTLPYSPGYCGMELTEQQKLFSLFEAQDINVDLTSACLMKPIKSVSGLIGLGRADDLVTLSSPCERCEFKNCNMRR
jgi:hypothetical protein